MNDGERSVKRGLWRRVRRRLSRGGLHLPVALRRQRGAALIMLMTVVVVSSAAVLLDRAETQIQVRPAEHDATAKALAEAKAALIAWAVSYPAAGDGNLAEDRDTAPGMLPFPDADGDGGSDCPAIGVAVTDADLLGRFPLMGQIEADCHVVPLGIDLRDGAGEPLWLAVSRNLLRGGGGGPINPDISDPSQARYPWIQLRDELGQVIMDHETGLQPLAVAAVIIAPGAPLAGQSRGAGAGADQFLDRITIAGTTYDNADVDGCPDNTPAPCPGLEGTEDFIVYPNPATSEDFNDQVIYITAAELMRAVEKRAMGEAAIALNRYRNLHNYFPWLARFRGPRGVAVGTVTPVPPPGPTGFGDVLNDFTDAMVVPGDVVVKLNNPNDPLDDARGPVTAVISATALGYNGLWNRSTASQELLAATDPFLIEPSAKSVLPVVREGALPVHLPDEIFYTGFDGDWKFVDATITSGSTDAIALPPPPDSEVEQGTIDNVTEALGRCMWSNGGASRVDCVAEVSLPNYNRPSDGLAVDRIVTYTFSFTGDNVGVGGPTAADVRRRDVSIHAPGAEGPLPEHVLATAPLLPQSPSSVAIQDSVPPGGPPANIAFSIITIDPDTTGYIRVRDIRYDLAVRYDDVDDANDEIPEWFVENGWHKYLYVALSSEAVASGSGACTAGTSCLTLLANGTVAMNNVDALVVAPGGPWLHQVRDTREGDCDGDGITDSPAAAGEFRCAYFEAENTAGFIDVFGNTDSFGRNIYSKDPTVPPPVVPFNDQVRVVATAP